MLLTRNFSSIIEIIRSIDVRAYITMFSQISRICTDISLLHVSLLFYMCHLYIYILNIALFLVDDNKNSTKFLSVRNYPRDIYGFLSFFFFFSIHVIHTRNFFPLFFFNNFYQQVLALYSVKVVSITKMVQLSPTEKDASSWFILIWISPKYTVYNILIVLIYIYRYIQSCLCICVYVY